MRALNDLKSQGKIRAIGVSNFSRAELEEAARFGRIESLQPPYSLLWRQVENEALPYCMANGLTVIAYSSMAQGILAGRFGAEPRFADGDHRKGHRLFQPDLYPQVLQAVENLKPIAQRNGITLSQLALVAHVLAVAAAVRLLRLLSASPGSMSGGGPRAEPSP